MWENGYLYTLLIKAGIGICKRQFDYMYTLYPTIPFLEEHIKEIIGQVSNTLYKDVHHSIII